MATPALTGADDNSVLPSMKLTVPALGVPEAAVMVAVRVTDWLKMDGFGDGARAVVVAMSTFCITAGEVPALKLTSPE